jgi:4-hydroxybenzoyl-CoA reductase subunit alpha
MTARFPGSAETHSREPAHAGVLGASGKGKIDGVAKVTGAARYTGDLVLPRMAHCKVVRSLHAHGRILSIDTSAALAMPGVLAVVTGEDLPIRYGALPVAQDETALAIGKVRYVG